MGLPIRVLIVEDSEDDAELLVRKLRGEYVVAFERVDTPGAMIKAISEKEWDIVICDYAMPCFSGMDALRLLRAVNSDVPFIFLSGRIGEEGAVAALKQGAQDYIMKGNLNRLLPAIQKELSEVQRRHVHERLELHVRQLEKFEAIGRLAGGIAHDFNNALTVIIGWSQIGYDEAVGSKEPRLQVRFQKICEEARRSADLTAQLLAFSRQQVLQKQDFDLNVLVTEATTLLRSAVAEPIEFKLTPAGNLRGICGDATQIRQVLVNLCLNARDAMPNGGQLIVETQNIEIGEEFCNLHNYGTPGEYVLLVVSDTGVGMDTDTLRRIFEPFFTTKDRGYGTGLGLATVYGIIKQHDGFVNVYSELGRGTTFRIYIPASSGVREARSVPVACDSHGGSETILVADDHAQLRELAYETLEARGYHVILVSDGAEAVRTFSENANGIDLVVLDVEMPHLSGPEAYSRMCLLNPNLRVIFATGHTTRSAALTPHIERGAVFLQKPYDPQTLRRAVRSRLDMQ
jgi:two-component system cell cycle sensor histidine kinase/response regulator CckA